MSDYFLTVICVKGNWSNYPHLATDPIWASYFDNKGILKDKVSSFVGAEGITLLGTWTGSIIPDFQDKQGNMQNLVAKINAVTEKTGLLATFNEDAAEVLAYDYNGAADEGSESGKGCWFYDIDGDSQMTTSQGEASSTAYLIDMVGHNFQKGFTGGGSEPNASTYYSNDIDSSYLSVRFANSSNYYLKSYDALTGTAAYTVEDEFTLNGEKYGYMLSYDPEEDVLTCQITSDISVYVNAEDTSDESYKYVEASGSIIRYTQLDTEDAVLEVDPSLYGTFTVSQVSGNDKVILTISDGSLAKKITYTSPSDDAQSASFGGAYYGNYLVLDFDSNGEVVDSDIYKLYEKAKTVRGTTTYYDVFEQTSSDINVDVNVNDEDEVESYVVTYPISKNPITYTITAEADVSLGNLIIAEYGSVEQTYGIDFLSYNYTAEAGVGTSELVSYVPSVAYFHDAGKTSDGKTPVEEDNFTTFIVMDDDAASSIKIGDYVNNIAFNNEVGIAQKYKTIPGLTRVIDKIFVNVNASSQFSYKSTVYDYTQPKMIVNTDFGTQGFYLFTTVDPVLIEQHATERDFVEVEQKDASGNGTGTFIKFYPAIWDEDGNNMYEDEVKDGYIKEISTWEDEYGVDYDSSSAEITTWPEAGVDYASIGGVGSTEATSSIFVNTLEDSVVRQLPITDDAVSASLRWIPLKGLKITSRHKPGYDADGNIDIEGGIEKIYAVLEDEGILRGLCNNEMVSFRYIVDSMGYGLDSGLGGKTHLARVAKQRGKCTALLNLPSMKEFACSENPYFCDSYVQGMEVKPAFNTKYIPEGGNRELYATKSFSLPSEDDGAKFAAAFWPYLTYKVGTKTLSVPPAADVSNTLMHKYQGGDPWMIVANLNGILTNSKINDIEYLADQEDRDYLEPMGINTLIKRNGQIMIYGNQTCYQALKSDFNKLHVRENLNTLEIECEAVLKQFNFLYNSAATRAAIVTKLTPILQAARNSGAINAYTIVCDESNNTSEVIDNSFGLVDIDLEMSKGMEKIVMSFTLQKLGTLSTSES